MDMFVYSNEENRIIRATPITVTVTFNYGRSRYRISKRNRRFVYREHYENSISTTMTGHKYHGLPCACVSETKPAATTREILLNSTASAWETNQLIQT
jgi:hypothetical protein